MNMKRMFLFLLLVLIAVAGIFAQSTALRGGVYQTRGSTVEITVMPNMDINAHGGNLYERNNYYLISTYNGPWNVAGPWCVDAGRIRGNEIQAYASYVDQVIGPQKKVALGDPAPYTVVNTESFRNSKGEVWVWNRELPKQQ